MVMRSLTTHTSLHMNATARLARSLYSTPNSIGSRFRARRIAPLIQMMEHAYGENGWVNLLDVGGKKGYWKIVPPEVLKRNKVRITILNLPCEISGDDDELFKHVKGDACELAEYDDHSFHIIHSNSVLEHVGDWTRMRQFAGEVRRLAPWLFIQTPYFWFPMEPHYMTPIFHWLPRPIQVSLIMRSTLGNRGKASDLADALSKVEDAPQLVDQRTFKLLFPDCRLVKERFLLLTKSLVALRGPKEVL